MVAKALRCDKLVDADSDGPPAYHRAMPLQNRVDPFGEYLPIRALGLFMGNRGGRIHTGERTLARRRWSSRQWICCVLDFKARHRSVWRDGYTELFFLDEVTALAAGHRPCFECRRRDATAFAECWRRGLRLPARPRAAQMDERLHARNGWTAATSGGIRWRLPICRTPPSLWSMVAPSRCAATSLLAGRRTATRCAGRGRAAARSTC